MAIFPTSHSMLAAQPLADYFGPKYGLGDLKGKLLLRGVSDTYLLEGTSGKYIAKVYRDNHRTLPEIQAEVELLNMLKAADIPVSYPFYDLEGNQLQPFEAAEGIRQGILFSYAPGEPVYAPTPAQLAITGHEMARLHNVTAGLQLHTQRRSYSIDTTIHHPLQVLEAPLTEMGLAAEYAWLLKAGHHAAAYLSAVDTDAFSYGYCQYDFMPKNFHFDSHDQITFFDFDFAGEGWLAHDLMSYWVHFAINAITGRSTKEEAEKDFGLFLDAYRQVRPLSDAEAAAIPYLNVGFWLFYWTFHHEHFEDFSSQFWGPRVMKERIGHVKKLWQLFIPALKED